MTPPAAAPAVHRGRSVAPTRPLTSAPRPRRVSGPARGQRPAPAVRRSRQADGGLVLGLLAAVRGLERYTLLDRMLRGRTWIGLIAFALIGIVALQLGLLKLNAGIGHSLEQEASLQRENAALKIESSELAAGERVEAKAAHLGMELVPVGALKALSVHPGADASRAASALKSASSSSASSETSASTASTPTSAITSATPEESAVASTPSTEQASTEAPVSETGEPAVSTGEPAPAASSAPEAEAATPASTEAPAPSTSATTAPTTEAAAGGGTQAGPAG
jgi:cell division protein FtsL